LIDPGAQELDLFATERFAPRRHPLVGIVRFNAADQLALGDPPRTDGCFPRIAGHKRSLTAIESQPTFLLVGSVALPAGTLEDGPHVRVEVNTFGLWSRRL
jgi:hypothetical protein